QPAQLAMPRLVDDPHPAAPDLGEDDVPPDLAGGRRSLARLTRPSPGRAPDLPTQGAGRPPPLGRAPRAIALQGRGGPQSVEEPVAHEERVHRRAAVLTNVQVLGDSIQVIVPERTGGKRAQMLGFRVIPRVRGHEVSLLGQSGPYPGIWSGDGDLTRLQGNSSSRPSASSRSLRRTRDRAA